MCHHHGMDTHTPHGARAARVAEDLRLLVGKLKRRLREQSDGGDLTPSQTAVLLRLEKHGPATASALARAEAMRPQSMGRIITVLESHGLIAGTPDPADGRQTLLALTDTCREWLARGRAARQDWLCTAIATHLDAHEQDELLAAVALLRRVIGE